DLLNSPAPNRVRQAEPGEFTLRAFLAGKLDLTQAEAVHGIIDAAAPDDLQTALAQLAGGLGHPLAQLRSDLLDLLADLEAGLDFVDEDIEFVSREAARTRIESGQQTLVKLAEQLQTRALHDRPLRVALVGPPNVGKSSLWNALLGENRALVSPVPGTTRDYLIGRYSANRCTLELIDTAGLGTAQDALDAAAQTLGTAAAAQADLVLDCYLDSPPAPQAHHWPLRMQADEAPGSGPPLAVSVRHPHGLDALRAALAAYAQTHRQSALASSVARCEHHLHTATAAIMELQSLLQHEEPVELLVVPLREALDAIGAMTGAVHTNDLLDRIFSRFCIGK
ncbi:MAG: GTPase, partial [Gemmataceae bacterium]